MVKFVAVVCRREGLGFEEFRRLWCEEHAELVLKMPGVLKYTQNLAFRGESRDWPMDGIAEVWFNEHEDVKKAFSSPEGIAANEHQGLFAGDVRWFLAEERTWDGVTK